MAYTNTKKAPLEKQTITIERVGQWGPMANGQYYGFNEPLTPNDFVVGDTIDVLVKRAAPTEKYPQGKLYIVQIVGNAAPVAPSLPKAAELMRDEIQPVAQIAAKEAKAAIRPGSYNDVNDPKSIRILRQGVFQHALVSPALATLQFKNADGFLELVKEVSEKVIKLIVDEK